MVTKTKKIVIFAAMLICLTLLIVGICVFAFYDPYKYEFFSQFHTTSKIGQHSEILGTTERRLPQVSNEGLERYPEYGVTLANATEAEKQAILAEDSFLRASSTTYDSMDAAGNLYLNGADTGRNLYKHTAADGMYYGNVADAERAVVKKIYLNPRARGNHLTGLYAPAGEVIKIEISAENLNKTGEIPVFIGQVLSNGQPNNIWLARDFNRMPVIVNQMSINKTVSYVGSYLGGPIYLGVPKNGQIPFEVTISGAVEYQHFILGYTTAEEFESRQSCSAPYFDLEVWDDGVRHSGPRSYASDFSYADLGNAAVLWDKISLVSDEAPQGSADAIGINFLYDPFVAAGAAVAFVGRNTVNCPPSWMRGALDYAQFVSAGSWGNVHEFNHHFQRFGFAPGDEVTNNALSLVSYSLFTDISSARALDDAAFGGWNRFTDPSRSLRETLAATPTTTPNYSLSTYADILHTFGQAKFLTATQYARGAGGVDKWYESLCETMKYDFSYYFEQILNIDVTDALVTQIGAKNYPMFVPVASIFQTGRSYLSDGEKEYSATIQPYVVETESFDFDLKSRIIVPDDFDVSILSCASEGENLVDRGNGVYGYSFGDKKLSNKIIATLQITKKDRAFAVENVELVLQFRLNKIQPTATTYYYNDAILDVFPSVDDAVSSNFAGSADKVTYAISGDAEVWWNSTNIRQNAVTDYKVKVYAPETATYRFSCRGKYSNLYISFDGVNYQKIVQNGANFRNNFADYVASGEYADYQLTKGQAVYLRAVLFSVDVSQCYFVIGACKLGNGADIPDRIKKTFALKNVEYAEAEFESEYFIKRNYTCQNISVTSVVDGEEKTASEEFSDGKIYSPDDPKFRYFGEWEVKQDYSNFGHIYATGKGELKFEFEGEQFALCMQNNTRDYSIEISIDGGDFVVVNGTSNAYISQILTKSVHNVVIRNIRGFSVDCIIIR